MNLAHPCAFVLALFLFHPLAQVPKPTGATDDMWRGLAQDARKLIEQGSVLESQGRVGEALALYQKAYAKYPNHTVTNGMVGLTLHKLGQEQQALPYLERALSLDRSSLFNYLNLIEVYSTLGERPRAAEVARECAAAFPRISMAQATLGDALYWTGQYDEAIAALSKAQSLPGGQQDQNLQEDLAWCYVAKQDYARAQQLFGSAGRIGITLGPKGLTVAGIYKNGPADRAGLRAGDQLLEMNGENLAAVAPAQLVGQIHQAPLGQKVHIKVLRAGQPLEMDVVVGVIPEPSTQAKPPEVMNPPISQPIAVAGGTGDKREPAVSINRVVIKPATVQAGGNFSIEVSYNAAVSGQIAYSFSIFDDAQKLLYESKPRTTDALIGNAGIISIQEIPSTKTPGKYTVRVQITLGDVIAKGEGALTISQK
jgi:tetratricopeptide (TPR) repeat protein